LCASLAAAEPSPVIQAGREAEVLALFAPFGLGQEVRDGYRLWNVRIEPTRIQVELRDAADVPATFALVHGHDGEHTASFSVRRDPSTKSGAAARATDALIDSAKKNDHGGFWLSLLVALGVPGLLALASALAMGLAARRARSGLTSPREPAR
jgi:hypothetical protein